MRTSILTGKRAQTMLSPVFEKMEPSKRPDLADDLYTKMVEGIEERAEQKAKEAMQPLIDAAIARAEAAEARAEAEKVSRGTLEIANVSLESRVSSLSDQVQKLEAKINDLRNMNGDKLNEIETLKGSANSQVRQLEKENSKLKGQLEQARMVKPETKIVQSAPAPIPSFKIEPQKDAAGNLIHAIVTPIGGH